MSEKNPGLSAEEKAAAKARAAELRAEARAKKAEDKLAAEAQAYDDALAATEGLDRELMLALGEIVAEVAPQLTRKTMYGMPAWARDGKTIFFFQPALKFKTRYPTLGFDAAAPLDDGEFWPTSFALTGMGPATRRRIAELVRQAAQPLPAS
jgi:uncharacterized protein YdhG (YjbR/CyaY superfamily)